ncbi:MAG: molybdopterin biosynthesis protein [Thermodesulfovibrionales bacterium]|nr:molybdopterin biosynthesis protein [Thermodesulfovibrionales bacterium]
MRRELFGEIKATPLDEALKIWLQRFAPSAGEGSAPGSEKIGAADSLGRVTAEAVVARLSSPFFHSSAMDGYAVRFADTFGASETSPKRLRLGAEALYVDTGDPLPGGFNAVVMVEDVNIVDSSIEIIAAVTPWQNVRVIGEDIVATELILPENHRIRPVDMAAMLAAGITEIRARKRPRVVVIPTGTEIVEPGSPLKEGDIIEYNSRMLGGLVTEWGGEFIRHPIVPDSMEKLKEAVASACACADMLVINAGASAGSEDFTGRVIREMGEVILHGLAIKPGKPLILGFITGKSGAAAGRATPVLGIPGYPVSAYLTFELFAKPVIYAWQGLTPEEPETIKAKLSRQVASPMGQEEFLRVKVGKVGDNFIATPLGRGAGLLMSLVRADGLLRIPAMSEGRAAGGEVDITLMRTKKDIQNTIVLIGSHDNTLDLLANVLKKRHTAFSLSSAHVGSMGGLVALKMSEAHIAPTHLLDEETGLYNIPFIKRLLPGRRVVLVNLVYRRQGLMVGKGNPKNITGAADLMRDGVTFINRQRGAGTRLLLDKVIKESGIDPKRITGYDREEYTHMAVASAVLTGLADTGMGILAAANALGLDFIPVAEERYDIAIAGEFMETPMLNALLEIIRGDGEFREGVLSLGGYDIRDMGKVMWEGPRMPE